jgi:hypothetical protein
VNYGWMGIWTKLLHDIAHHLHEERGSSLVAELNIISFWVEIELGNSQMRGNVAALQTCSVWGSVASGYEPRCTAV